MGIRRPTLALVCALALGVPHLAHAAADPTLRCGLKRISAIGKLVKKSLGCEAKGAGKGLATDPACLDKARTKFEAAIPAADTGLGCIAELDASLEVLSDVADGIPDDALLLLRGVRNRSRCDKLRLKGMGVAAAAALKARGKHLKTGDEAKLDASLAKARAKLAKAFTKGDKKGDCTSAATPERMWQVVEQALCAFSGLGTFGTQITPSSPSSGLVTQEPALDFMGSVVSAPACAEVDVWGFRGAIDPSGGYLVERVPLLGGTTDLPVRVMAGRVPLAETTTTIIYEPAGEAAADVDPAAGGTATVLSGPLTGAAIFVPPGAARATVRVRVVDGDLQLPVVPFGEVEVGPSVLFGPQGAAFDAAIELTLPVDPLLLPPGTTIDDVEVRGVGDDGWVLLPVVRTAGNAVVVALQELVYGPFVPVVLQPLQSGELLVTSEPARATIYVDGGDTGLLTPAIVPGLTLGDREVKLYVPGFNEAFALVSVGASGGRLHLDLGRPGPGAPRVEIDSPRDGASTLDSFVDLTARATLGGSPLGGGTAVVSVNGADSLAAVQAGGTVAAAVPLAFGDNTIEVRVNAPGGETGVSDPIIVTRRRQLARGGPPEPIDRDLTIQLAWGTDGTDIDLHVFQDGNHAWFGDRTGIPGGVIDRDDTDGRGPEIFTLPDAPPGMYRIAVDAYRIDDTPTTASLTVTLGTREEFSDTYTFTADDANATNGSPVGASPAAFWDALEFEITELRIDYVRTVPVSSLDNAIFTTMAGENEILLGAHAPPSMPDEDINWLVEEVNEGFDILTDPLEGRDVKFFAAHQPLLGLINPRHSKPLVYEIIAHTTDLQTTSRPVRLTQGVLSQIRQEYVDKRAFEPSFVRETPALGQILDATRFTRGPDEVWDFGAYAVSSDFAGLAVINDSRNIANTVSRAWQAVADRVNPTSTPVPVRLRLTSGWRNPRRNDAQSGSSINSFHQSGDAIDFNPTWSEPYPLVVPGCIGDQPINVPLGLPPGTTPQQRKDKIYEQARAALACLARKVLPAPTYWVDIHGQGPHVHIGPPHS